MSYKSTIMDERILNSPGFLFEEETTSRKRGLNILYLLLFVGFFLSLYGLQKFPMLFFVNKACAGLLIVVSFLSTQKFYTSTVLKWYGIFMVVVFLAGSLVATNPESHADTFFKMVQLLLILVAISQFYIFAGDVRFFAAGIVIVGIMMCFVGRFLDPDIAFSGKIERYSSITKNSNGFAFQLLFSSVAALYFWDRGKLMTKVIILGLLAFFLYYISISGSRKSLVSFAVVIMSWIFFSFKLKKQISYFFAIFLIGAIAGSYLYTLLEDTAVFVRFSQLEDNTGGTDIRKSLYAEAFEVFKSSPVVGVGLNNFREYSYSGLYAHSNYMELLADTGIIGFVLFFTLYLRIWLNSNKLNKLHDNKESVLAYTGLFKTSLILLGTISLGAVMYDSIPHWVLLLLPIVVFEKERMTVASISEEEFTPEEEALLNAE